MAPNPMNTNNAPQGVTPNQSGNPQGSINPSMGGMNNNMGNVGTQSNMAPNPINTNNAPQGVTPNQPGNPQGSINPSMGGVNNNMGNVGTPSNMAPNPMNTNNASQGVTPNQSGNPQGSINPNMGGMNNNMGNVGTPSNMAPNPMNINNLNNIPDNLNNTMPNTRSEDDRVTCNESKVKNDKDYINDDVEIIDIEEVEPAIKENEIKNVLEYQDEDYNENENRMFEEYEKEIERLKNYRKKHSKKKNKYDDNWKAKPQCDCEEMKPKKKHEDCKSEKYKKNEWNDKDYPVGNMGKFFKEVTHGLEKIGSNENIKNCFWYKAHVKKLEDMYCVYDYNKYSVVFYPMICYYPYISRHGNFMIGYKCDDEGRLKYIIYAIPGTRSLSDQPYEGKTGFVTFMPDEDNDKFGHWLMYYDIKGNTVVVPVKR